MEDTADTGYNQVGIENWDKGQKELTFITPEGHTGSERTQHLWPGTEGMPYFDFINNC